MEHVDEIFVISDLHLGPTRNHDLFRADTALAKFLDWFADTASPQAKLVLAGDTFDFLAPLTDGSAACPFEPIAASARAGVIVDNHPEVFDSLAGALNASSRSLLVLGGNHDPELVFKEVQSVLVERLQAAGRRPDVRFLVNGEAASLSVAGQTIVIEHGDLFDDWNRINHTTLRRAVSRISRGFTSEHGHLPPPGTRIILDYVHSLRGKYPWVDCLKPEREAVFPLVLAFLPLSEKLKFLNFLRSAAVSLGRSFLTELYLATNPARLVRDEKRTQSDRTPFLRWLGARDHTKASNPLSERQIARMRLVAANDHQTDPHIPDSTLSQVASILDRGADLVIAGHTHAPKAYCVGSGAYVNAGSWARTLRLPDPAADDTEWGKFIDLLASGADLGATDPTFAIVRHLPEGLCRATLNRWVNDRPEEISRLQRQLESGRWTHEHHH